MIYNIVKNEIRKSVKGNSGANGYHVLIPGQQAPDNKDYCRSCVNKEEVIVLLEYRFACNVGKMVILMKRPEEAMHYIFMV